MVPTTPTTVIDLVWMGFYLLLVGGVGDVIRRLCRIERRQEQQKDNHSSCRLSIEKELADKVDWESFYNHSHDHTDNRVKR